jgi:lactoylglutathione lyase
VVPTQTIADGFDVGVRSSIQRDTDFLQPEVFAGCEKEKRMRVKKLLHTRMRVSDMAETLGFYRDVLGLDVVEQKVSPRGSHLAFLAVPNSEELIELCSFPASGSVTVQADLVHLAFEVEDLDQTIQELQAKGVPITDGPTQSSSGSRFIFIDAPDGYEIELIQRPAGVAIV